MKKVELKNINLMKILPRNVFRIILLFFEPKELIKLRTVNSVLNSYMGNRNWYAFFKNLWFMFTYIIKLLVI